MLLLEYHPSNRYVDIELFILSQYCLALTQRNAIICLDIVWIITIAHNVYASAYLHNIIAHNNRV